MKYYIFLITLSLTYSVFSAETLKLEQMTATLKDEAPSIGVLFGEITNLGKEEIIISDIVSSDFSITELHTVLDEKGISKMRKVNFYKVAPNKKLTLGPGKEHVMLFKPKRFIKAGEKISFSLVIKNSKKQIPFQVEVQN